MIAEDNYGNKFMTTQFIKAAGGCSAPSIIKTDKVKGSIEVREPLIKPGITKFQFWHPNYSGMQFNQVTRAEIPAEYIDNVKMWVDENLVWEYNGTIGIAQDVFFMMPIHTIGKYVKIYAKDNLGNEFNYDNTN